MCQIIEYNSLKTIIQTIAVISASIHGIQVRFNHSATMKGNNRRTVFFTNHSDNLLLSICCHLDFALNNQKIKSRSNITVITINHSWLIEKYSNIQATVSHQNIQNNAHCVSVICLHKNSNKNNRKQAHNYQELEQCNVEFEKADKEYNSTSNHKNQFQSHFDIITN